jgi:hypothetical protein
MLPNMLAHASFPPPTTAVRNVLLSEIVIARPAVVPHISGDNLLIERAIFGRKVCGNKVDRYLEEELQGFTLLTESGCYVSRRIQMVLKM